MKKTVLLVSHDQKTIAQISRWLKELDDQVVLETANSIDELKLNYLSLVTSGLEEAKSKQILRLMIFDVAVFGAIDPLAFISQTRATLQSSKWCSAESPLKVMILSFDNATLPLHTFVDKEIDDLLMKPIDHQLFLQKTGMLIADKSNTAGNFLFKQKAKFTVEMAKEVRIVKMSEFGVVISNPSPLAPGVFAHLYSPIFASKTKPSVWCRVFSTRRDPKVPGNYLCFFTFFGIQADQLSIYRRALRDRRKELRLVDTGFEKNRVPAAIRHVAVIDRVAAKAIGNSLSANYLNLKTYEFSSYAQFLKAVSGSAANPVSNSLSGEGSEPSKPFNGPTLTLVISPEKSILQHAEPPIDPNSLFCGAYLSAHEDSNTWLNHLSPLDREEWDELLLTVERSNKAEAILTFKNINGEEYLLLARAQSERNSRTETRLVRVELTPLNAEEIKSENNRRSREQAKFPHIDAIYIDALSIRDFPVWYDSLKDLLRKSNLLITEKLPICILLDEKPKLDTSEFRIRGVADLIFKPADHRFIAAKAAVLINDLVPSNDENVDLSFTPSDFPARIAKQAELNEVAEFGFQIKSAIPLREGIFLRFFSQLFLDEKGEGVLARSTSCTATPNEKDSFNCFFTFFGVSDAQLKHIRNWIREDYVNKKDAG